MKVTFDLNEAEIFLPTGRVMNLKKDLGWDEAVEKSRSLISEIGSMDTSSFSPKLDTQKELEKAMKQNFLANDYVAERKQAYRQHVLKKAEELIEKSPVLSASLAIQSELEDIAMSLMNSNVIQTKLRKLNQLREINLQEQT